MRGLPRRKVASGQMHLYHTAGLEFAVDLQLTNTSQRTRRRILPVREMTIKITADVNTVTAIEMTTSLHINPEGDQGADPTLDIEGVTPDAEAILEVLLIHILKEDITPAGGPGHDPEPDPGPGLGLTGEDRGLIPTPTNQGQNQGQDQVPGEDIVTISEAVMIPDLQTACAQNRTPSPHKRNIKFNQS